MSNLWVIELYDQFQNNATTIFSSLMCLNLKKNYQT